MEQNSQPNKDDMNKQELIGYHKGSLNTLTKEYQELARLLNIVQQLMQAHVKELEELGVNIQSAQNLKENSQSNTGNQDSNSSSGLSGWESSKPLEEELE